MKRKLKWKSEITNKKRKMADDSDSDDEEDDCESDWRKTIIFFSTDV